MNELTNKVKTELGWIKKKKSANANKKPKTVNKKRKFEEKTDINRQNNKKKTETVHEISNMPKLKTTSPNKSGQLHVGHAKR